MSFACDEHDLLVTLFLTNDEVERLLPMADCIDALGELYRDIVAGMALSRRRSDTRGQVRESSRIRERIPRVASSAS